MTVRQEREPLLPQGEGSERDRRRAAVYIINRVRVRAIRGL